MSEKLRCDVAVVGAGHAGVEAAAAAARLGCDTVLFTLSLDGIANMPCNPCIGGTGKGHLVYEIDALGGVMGRAADMATISSRTLNESKGAAVRSKRAQTDRRKYKAVVTDILKGTANLRLVGAEISGIETADGKITALTTKLGDRWECGAAVLCCGTYLCGTVHVGDIHYSSGPDGTLAANALSGALSSLGIRLMRFKTGTPVRVSAKTIDFSRLELQSGEANPIPFSKRTPENYLSDKTETPCHIVYTNEKTHEIIRKNLSRSAMYSGNIHGMGPRYCPSIEDKIVRFPDKEHHQLFVEPMGEGDDETYISGFSTSMPTVIQREMLHSLDGFESAHITRNAYAIEYDLCDPTELDATLGFRKIRGLYGAGQFNGTSGYEEAAAQGLVAGANAALFVLRRPPLIVERASSYIGIMIDDLVTRGVSEPYRIMTSRSEYRLFMRQDNADERLTPKGHDAGLIDEDAWEAFLSRRERTRREISRLASTVIRPTEDTNKALSSLGTSPILSAAHADELLRRPEVSYEALTSLTPAPEGLTRAEALTVETEIKYEGYLKKQEAAIKKAARAEGMKIPEDINYLCVRGMRAEAAAKLSERRPLTVGQASRISGVNPADITALLIYIEAERRGKAAKND